MSGWSPSLAKDSQVCGAHHHSASPYELNPALSVPMHAVGRLTADHAARTVLQGLSQPAKHMLLCR